VGVDAVDAQDDERSCKQRGEEPGAIGQRFQQGEEEAPGEEGCGSSLECGADEVGIVDAAEEADDEGMDEKGERRVGEGEVAVGELAERDAVAGVKQVGDVPEDGNAGVLPEGEGGRGEEERGGGEGVAKPPCRACGHD
jgi:hypothetical protein